MSSLPDLSIVIATWNGRAFLEACLHSIYENTSEVSFEIIVVDNGSADGTLDTLTAFPQVQVIRNRTNMGVAAARNQGMRRSKGRYVLLLDDDTKVTPGALDALFEFMDGNPHVGLAAPKLVSPEGKLQLICRQFPTVYSKILRQIPYAFARDWPREEMLADWDHKSVREVDYVIGACQMIRREAFEEVGFLDDNIFYGPEDIDYCIRMWRKGWAVVYNPFAVVVHHEQRTTRRKLFSRLTWQHLKGLIYYFLKYRYLFDISHLKHPQGGVRAG